MPNQQAAYAATQTEPEPLLLTLEGAGRALALSRATIYRMINSGVLPVVRIGGSVRVRPADVRALVERSTIEKVTDPGEQPEPVGDRRGDDDVRPS